MGTLFFFLENEQWERLLRHLGTPILNYQVNINLYPKEKKKSESPIRQLPSQYKSNFKKKEKRIRWINLILYLSGAYKFKSNIENSIVER